MKLFCLLINRFNLSLNNNHHESLWVIWGGRKWERGGGQWRGAGVWWALWVHTVWRELKNKSGLCESQKTSVGLIGKFEYSCFFSSSSVFDVLKTTTMTTAATPSAPRKTPHTGQFVTGGQKYQLYKVPLPTIIRLRDRQSSMSSIWLQWGERASF